MRPTVQNPNPTQIQTADWEYDERRIEREAEKGGQDEGKKPIFSQGSIVTFRIPTSRISEVAGSTLRSVGGLTQDTGEYGLDLINQFIGLGEYKPSAPTPETQHSTSYDAQPGAANLSTKESEDAEKIRKPLNVIDAYRNTIPLEVYKQLRAEALMENMDRIVGREISDKEAREQGYLSKGSIATMVGIANKDSEVKEAAAMQEEAPIPSPARKEANAADVEYEGGAGTVGSGKANLRFGTG